MANIPIWPGSSSFFPGDTPFGFYDYDVDFQTDAPKIADWCAQRLGYPIENIELQSIQFFAAFEEAVSTYGNEVFQYKIRENYLSMEGANTGSSFNGKVIAPNLENTINIADTYGTEAQVGGTNTLYTGSIRMSQNVQSYDLNNWATSESIDGGIEIRRVFYEAPPAILRYFDPYAGTGTGIQGMLDAFGFGNMSPAVNFLMMPISFDVQKLQAIELNDQIRKSAYTFEIQNNQLRIFPVPREDRDLFFQYYKVSEKRSPVRDNTNGLITNIGDVPYENPRYAHINTVGRDWIRRYTLALIMETLGFVRGKYSTVPIPGAEVTLNSGDLLTKAASEKEALLVQLRETLEQTSRKSQLERKAEESSNLNNTLNNVPLTIYIG
jgi:hypothetical protein